LFNSQTTRVCVTAVRVNVVESMTDKHSYSKLKISKNVYAIYLNLQTVVSTYAMVTREIKLFQPPLTYNWINFISVCGNLPEIISVAYCSSWIFSNVFSVAEIIFEIISAAETFISVSDVVTCEIKCRINFRIISKWFHFSVVALQLNW